MRNWTTPVSRGQPALYGRQQDAFLPSSGPVAPNRVGLINPSNPSPESRQVGNDAHKNPHYFTGLPQFTPEKNPSGSLLSADIAYKISSPTVDCVESGADPKTQRPSPKALRVERRSLQRQSEVAFSPECRYDLYRWPDRSNGQDRNDCSCQHPACIVANQSESRTPKRKYFPPLDGGVEVYSASISTRQNGAAGNTGSPQTERCLSETERCLSLVSDTGSPAVSTATTSRRRKKRVAPPTPPSWPVTPDVTLPSPSNGPGQCGHAYGEQLVTCTRPVKAERVTWQHPDVSSLRRVHSLSHLDHYHRYWDFLQQRRLDLQPDSPSLVNIFTEQLRDFATVLDQVVVPRPGGVRSPALNIIDSCEVSSADPCLAVPAEDSAVYMSQAGPRKLLGQLLGPTPFRLQRDTRIRRPFFTPPRGSVLTADPDGDGPKEETPRFIVPRWQSQPR